MAPMMLIMFIIVMIGGSDAAWCVCKNDASTTNLQKALDYACGAGADCNPIHQNGACYNPNTVVAHCSYAANSYYQRNAQNQQACDFAGAAQLSPADPSYPGCTFPANPSAAGSSSTPSTAGTPNTTGTPSTAGAPSTTGTPSTVPTTNTTPIIGGGGGSTGTTFNPNTPTNTGGSGYGMGPSTVGFDGSHATTNFHPNLIIYSLFVLTFALLKI